MIIVDPRELADKFKLQAVLQLKATITPENCMRIHDTLAVLADQRDDARKDLRKAEQRGDRWQFIALGLLAIMFMIAGVR